jgi:anti-sigma factor RsiW
MTDHPTSQPTRPSGHAAPEDLSALLDGEAPEAPASWIEGHLASCRSCRRQRDRLAEVHQALAGLVTPAPAGAASAVAVALEAFERVRTVSTGAAAGASPGRGRLRQRSLRPVGIAAGFLLAAGIVSGLIVAGQHDSSGGYSGAAAGAHGGPTGVSRTSASSAGRGSFQLAASGHESLAGRPLASIARPDVAAISVRPGPGSTFTAEITLEKGHLLKSRVDLALRAAGASALLDGRSVGTVRVLSARTLEVTGLSGIAARDLKRLLN